MRPPTPVMAYAKCFAAQEGALGAAGQRRLQQSTVLIVGAGGLGTSICTTLALAGVGRLLVLDPQRVEVENMNRYAFMRADDVGKLKVDVVSSFFDGRPHVQVLPFPGRAEDLEGLETGDSLDLVVSASNTVSSRIAAAHAAVRLRVPHVSAGLTDGRQSNCGLVVAWAPDSPTACPACFLRRDATVRRGDSLLATTIAIVGAAAAAVAVRLLSHKDAGAAIDQTNCIAINADRMTLEPLRVLPMPHCPACRRRRRGEELP